MNHIADSPVSTIIIVQDKIVILLESCDGEFLRVGIHANLEGSGNVCMELAISLLQLHRRRNGREVETLDTAIVGVITIKDIVHTLHLRVEEIEHQEVILRHFILVGIGLRVVGHLGHVVEVVITLCHGIPEIHLLHLAEGEHQGLGIQAQLIGARSTDIECSVGQSAQLHYGIVERQHVSPCTIRLHHVVRKVVPTGGLSVSNREEILGVAFGNGNYILVAVVLLVVVHRNYVLQTQTVHVAKNVERLSCRL